MRLSSPSAAPGEARGGGVVISLADQALLSGLVLFALSIPHSIAAAYIGLGLSALAWIARAVAARQLRLIRTPLDGPLICFAVLSFLAALLSESPGLSLPKLRSLIIFVLVWLITANLPPRRVRLLVGLVICSGLVGVGFSLVEKAIGRGLIVTAINRDSPLAHSNLQPGDVIWMIERHRVRSLADLTSSIRRLPAGQKAEFEALHDGDPLPVELLITDELKTKADPLGISVGGSSRRFRASGFSRHFITWADQIQLLALLSYGFVMVLLKKASPQKLPVIVATLIFSLFSLALILTSSRAAVAAFVLALFIVAVMAGGRRMVVAAALVAVLIGGLTFYAVIGTRTLSAAWFGDDSAARRIGYMRAGLRLIPQHPWFGVGMDSHKLHWKEWGFPGDYVTHTHSTPIQLAMDRGLPALGCYLWLMTMMWLTAWRGYQTLSAGDEVMRSGLLLGVVGGVIGFFAGSLVNYNFGDSEVMLLLLFLWSLALVSLRDHTAARQEMTHS